MTFANYDRFPTLPMPTDAVCWRGWDAIVARLGREAVEGRRRRGRWLIAVETYTGVDDAEVLAALLRIGVDHVVLARDAMIGQDAVDELVAPFLGGDDPLFGRLCPLGLDVFLDDAKLQDVRRRVQALDGIVLLYGTGALLLDDPDTIVYADLPRWEGQLRQRRGRADNLGVANRGLRPALQYKRSFFVDWRVCDRHKAATLHRWDYLLDTTVHGDPKLITGDALRDTLDVATRRPFRVVPFFDPAPWGGQWMRDAFGLPGDAANFGWGFDCVPEENSLLLACGETTIEVPAINLVLLRPRALLGDDVYARFGAEFPIRFDLLDTVRGGNLSLQVHPRAVYARDQFGLDYTQDESYYILHAEPTASVYLGTEKAADSDALFDLLAAPDALSDRIASHVRRWPAARHDHFLIPAGALHCSGAGAVVLEISATPYLFTFKLWDWGRLGLDGRPRPLNLARGRANLRPEIDADFAARELVNAIEPVAAGDGWREERTGLHASQPIEVRRHWFTSTVPHDTHGTLNVLNLVQGRAAVVESQTGTFAPIVVHFAETIVIPAAIGAYTIRPADDSIGPCATLKASVRPDRSTCQRATT